MADWLPQIGRQYCKVSPSQYLSTVYLTFFTRTVFLGGDTFAPKLKVRDKTGQEFLQGAFLDCWRVICQYTADLEAVLGYQV